MIKRTIEPTIEFTIEVNGEDKQVKIKKLTAKKLNGISSELSKKIEAIDEKYTNKVPEKDSELAEKAKRLDVEISIAAKAVEIATTQSELNDAQRKLEMLFDKKEEIVKLADDAASRVEKLGDQMEKEKEKVYEAYSKKLTEAYASDEDSMKVFNDIAKEYGYTEVYNIISAVVEEFSADAMKGK